MDVGMGGYKKDRIGRNEGKMQHGGTRRRKRHPSEGIGKTVQNML